MNPQGERWTTDQVLALAPDEASRKASGRLAAPGPWSETGADGSAVWGLCKGSGKKPYQAVVDFKGPAFTCSCPSFKFPCKHALGLLLLWAGDEGAVAAGEPPQWAGEWLAARRERAERSAAGPSGAAATRAPADPEAARRRAERRMQRIGAGAMELEQRLADLLQSGLATAGREGGGAPADGGGGRSWDETAARMVDAQAPGLASRVRELGSVVVSGADWPARLLEECALLHLLDQGFLGIDRLPAPLAATVRARVGLTTDAADLLTGPDAAPVRDRWLVLAQQDGDDGRLTTRRIFLRGERTGRMALHLSFAGANRPLELALPTGLVIDADLAYYPGARPLRATLGEQYAPATPGPVPPGCGIDAALAAYGDALRDDPWLDSWPVVLADVTPIPGRDGRGWQLADADGESALPLDPRCLGGTGVWQLAAISGGAPITVFGECGHRGFLPLTAWDPSPVSL
ncbi:SWIM zinc finger family protein [Streptomyces bugieae]|uniref:SWIM zinc finger family protein n=1 Tax=Streptomyces bugieae TaxID=3098223 RepID=A0ABU7NSN0_9ACTN|nr:SWIM zinc finger family protein [Streptomyces sp. DSM 41528]